MVMRISICLIAASLLFSVGCDDSGPSITPPTSLVDIDGNEYDTVVICGRVWMKENLKTTHYVNGDLILSPIDEIEWVNTVEGAFAHYDNVAENTDTFGLLYNWQAAQDTRGLCPFGWHVPLNSEFEDLIDCLGGRSVAGGKMKSMGTLGSGTGLWLEPNIDATNSSGFSGLPAGSRQPLGGYEGKNWNTAYWSDSISGGIWPYYYELINDNAGLDQDVTANEIGISVRCIKDL
jgi:uncharacterized protein (TIGR02145 family)